MLVVQPRNPGKTEKKKYKNKKRKKKKVGSPYSSLTPALIIDQNKGAEKAPQGQRRNEEIT